MRKLRDATLLSASGVKRLKYSARLPFQATLNLQPITKMFIHGDGIPNSSRALCIVKWKGKRLRCIGWYQQTEGCRPVLKFSQHSIPDMDSMYGAHSLEFDATNLTIRPDPSGNAAWFCDEELNADAKFLKTD
jgi:hypothetical protein